MKHPRKLDKRRTRESRTNYKRRLNLLKSNSPRLVVRKSNKYVYLQIVESIHAQDKVLFSADTKELLKYNWTENKSGSLKSLSASYLAGFLIGKKAKSVKTRVIPDIGLIPNTKGSRVYAAIKGASDAGLDVKYDEEVIPPKDKIEKPEFFSKVKGAIKWKSKIWNLLK